MRRIVPLLVAPIACAHAGMPSIGMTDLGRFRLESLSFFLVLLLAVSWVVWRLWNGLRADIPALPALRWRGALALTALWGLLVLVVLTMISGARELLTPKAWTRAGLTHRLSDEVAADGARRREALEDLRDALWRWADAHDGAWPGHEFGAELPERRWLLPGTTLRYRFDPGAPRGSARPLAWEPGAVPEPRLALLADGTIGPVPEMPDPRAEGR